MNRTWVRRWLGLLVLATISVTILFTHRMARSAPATLPAAVQEELNKRCVGRQFQDMFFDYLDYRARRDTRETAQGIAVLQCLVYLKSK